MIKQQLFFHMNKIITLFLALLSPIIFSNECGEYLENFNSPVCTKAKYIFWTGTAATIALRLAKKTFDQEVQARATQKNHLKRWGQVGGDIGYGYLNTTYILGQSLFGGKNGGPRAEHMLESSLYSLGVTQIIKKSVHETRPGFPDDPESFPSGHSSFSFAFASVVTAQHGWAWGGAAHLFATYISYSRINDNWHYIHDVVFGITIGMSYGWGIYYNHKEHSKPYWFSLLPTKKLDGAEAMLAFQY